jgi:hypothetical protein
MFVCRIICLFILLFFSISLSVFTPYVQQSVISTFIWMSIHLSVSCLSSFISRSVYLSDFLYFSICMSVYQSVFIYFSICLSASFSISPFLCLSICSSTRPSFHSSVSLFVSLSLGHRVRNTAKRLIKFTCI